jgi:type I restriction enzyme S subunit
MNTLRLGEIAVFVSKGTTPTSVGLEFTPKGVPFLRGEDIIEVSVDPSRATMFISDDSHNVLSRSAIEENDVLITIAGTIGRVGVYSGTKPANCNQAVAIVRLPPSMVDPVWLCLLLRSPKYQRQFTDFIAGGAIPNVSLTQIRSIELPELSLSEQKATVEAVRGALAAADSAIIAQRVQMQELSALADALIRSTTGTNKVKTAAIGVALNEVKQGVGVDWKDWPVLGATRAGLAPARERPGKHAERYKPVTAGTVFYNPMRILIGSIAFVDDDDEPGITSPDYVVLKGKPGVVDSRWFYYWLRSPLGERCIQSLARGAVRERMLFNRLAEGEIELPDYDTQLKASQALAQIKPMRAAIQQQLAELELLPQKLLAQIFES